MKSKSKCYPRATVRKIIKAHSRKSIGKAIDPLVFLNYVLFMRELMQNATRKARAEGEKMAAAKDIRKVTTVRMVPVQAAGPITDAWRRLRFDGSKAEQCVRRIDEFEISPHPPYENAPLPTVGGSSAKRTKEVGRRKDFCEVHLRNQKIAYWRGNGIFDELPDV